MLNNRPTAPKTEDLDNETAVWDRLRADIEGGRRSSDVYRAAQRGEASDSVYLEYDEEELSAAMQASEHDAPGRSQREHEFSDLEERISEAEVPLDDESLLEMEPHVQAEPPVSRRSQPPAQSVATGHDDLEHDELAEHEVAHHELAHDELAHHEIAEEAQTQERISYFEQAQAEAYRQSPIAAFAEEHAAALAAAQGQSRYEQAWAEWDRQFEALGHSAVIASAVEPTAAGKRSRLLVPGVALAALVGLGAAAYQLVIVPGQQSAETTPAAGAAAAAAPQAKEPAVEEPAANGEAAQQATDEAIARADEAAKAANHGAAPTPAAQVNPTRAADEPQARVAPPSDDESPEARRERIRAEKSAARREARHRRREEKRQAELSGKPSRDGESTERVSARGAATADDEEEVDEGETIIKPEPVKKKKGGAAAKSEKSGEDSDDPLYGLE